MTAPINDSRKIAWTSELPQGSNPLWVPILVPKPYNPVTAFVVSEKLEGVITHWVDQRTVPCFGALNGCKNCGSYPWRWKGYLAVWVNRVGRYHLAEISKNAARTCAVLKDPNAALRGRKITLRRSGEAKNSAVVAELSDTFYLDGLPKPIDVRAALEIIWFGDRPRS